MKNKKMFMENVSIQEKPALYYCSNCRRMLSAEQFYATRGQTDRYCKECRKAYMRRQRQADSPVTETYPVIPRIADRELRMTLIRHAAQVVRDSVLRKRKRLIEESEDD